MISNDRFTKAPLELSPNRGRGNDRGVIIKPDTLVIHSTAGQFAGDKSWILNPKSQVSYHILVGRKAELVQFMPFNNLAWHAGVSEWKKRKFANGWSIGLAFSNFGLLTIKNKEYYSSLNVKVPENEVVLIDGKYWHTFTPNQLSIGLQIAQAIKATYPIKEVVTHAEISPGRKIDPGPAFPINDFR